MIPPRPAAKRGMLKVMASFFQGLGLAFSGIKTAFASVELRRSYLRYVAFVLVLALAFEWALWHYLSDNVPEWVQAVGAWAPVHESDTADPSWWDRLLTPFYEAQGATLRGVAWTLAIVLWILSAILAPYLAFALINALIPMFNEAIFMGSLKTVDIPLHASLEMAPGRALYKSFGFSLYRLLRFLLGTIAIGLLGFIPLIGSVLSPALSAVWTAHNLSWELLDPYFDRRNDSWSTQKQILAENRALRLGFATPVALILAIPIVGVFFFAMVQASAATLASKIESRALALSE